MRRAISITNTETAAVTQQVEELFKKAGSARALRSRREQGLEDALTRLYFQMLVSLLAPLTLDSFIAIRTPAEIYFIANTSNRSCAGDRKVSCEGKDPEMVGPLHRRIHGCPGVAAAGSTAISFAIDLEPYGSRLLVFTDGAPPPLEARPSELARREAIDISRDWDVTFEGTYKKITMDALRPWTEIAGMQYFSGRATYERKVYVPPDFLRVHMRVYLDLGDPTPIPMEKAGHDQAWLDGPVREAAEIYVNGRRAGSIWHPPYELEVSFVPSPWR